MRKITSRCYICSPSLELLTFVVDQGGDVLALQSLREASSYNHALKAYASQGKMEKARLRRTAALSSVVVIPCFLFVLSFLLLIFTPPQSKISTNSPDVPPRAFTV